MSKGILRDKYRYVWREKEMKNKMEKMRVGVESVPIRKAHVEQALASKPTFDISA